MINTCENPGKCKVVLVEDDRLLMFVMSTQLESVGISFCAASNGSDALALIKSHHPKVLLLDISVPGMSGFEIVEAIRQDPDLTDLNNMNLVVHTSHDLTAEEQKRLTIGRTLFLTKTKVSGELSDIVRKLLAETA